MSRLWEASKVRASTDVVSASLQDINGRTDEVRETRDARSDCVLHRHNFAAYCSSAHSQSINTREEFTTWGVLYVDQQGVFSFNL